MEKYRVLKQYFGYDNFRPGQEALIDSLLDGRDVLGVMPTGGGKSLCYQIPAMLMSGITFVVSPLISLMQDQVMQLRQAGVSGAYINSTLSPEQLGAVYRNLYAGKYKIVYVAPERLETEDFRICASRLDISLLAVDEAHCISQWGQDFRPSYLEIPKFISILGKRPAVAAFTATATEKVQSDIREILGLKNPKNVVTSFDRPNLSFDVIRPANRTKALCELVRERENKCGIIYCATRKNVERICEKLCNSGFAATRYHAGLEDDERSRNQEDFLCDRKTVMVATNAFGMGINKSNVNYVIHYNMPKSLEEYYQEAGRAGRDGERAECILMYGASDIFTAKMMIENGGNENMTEAERSEFYRKSMERLKVMTDYCETSSCYREKILGYFGEAHFGNCANCGNCKGEYENKDITLEAQLILSCIERIRRKLGFCLGKASVIAVLRDTKNENITKYGIDASIGKTYGSMSKKSAAEVTALFDYLVTGGYIVIDSVYKTACVTEKAKGVLAKDSPDRVFMAVRKKSAAELIPKAVGKKKKSAKDENVSETDADLFEILRKLRLEIAAREKQPPFVIFHDSTLRDMAAKMPKTARELLEVSGIGERKAEKYGRMFLEKIAEYQANCRADGRDCEQAEKSDIIKKPQTGSGASEDLKQSEAAEIFAEMLAAASRALSETEALREASVPPQATVVMTASGSINVAVNTDVTKGLSYEEKALLEQLRKFDDTRVLKMLTLWADGAVDVSSMAFRTEMYRLNRSNAETEVLISKTPRNIYGGNFVYDNYNVKKLRMLIMQ